MQTSEMGTSEHSSSSDGLVRVIGRWSMAALVVNCIIGSGVFGLPSVLASLLGRASIVAVVVAAVAVGVIMACFAEVASRFAQTGGPYLYAQQAFGRFMGIQVAWLVWFVRLTACAANANLFVIYLGEFWPGATRPAMKLLILTLLIGILAAINFWGVKAGTHVSTTFTVAKLASLGAVAVAGAIYLIAAHKIIPPVVAHPGTNQWAHAIVLLVFAYGGFEAALISAGEAKDPRRDQPFGLFAGLITCAVIYGLIQWVVVGVLPDPAHSERPLADVARIIMGSSGASLTALGALLSIYGYLSGNILATPRITFALAERGDFPSLFAKVHPRFRTPYVSIAVFALLTWLLALFGSFAGNATLSAGSRLFYYGVVCASLPALRRKSATPALLRVPGGTFIAVIGMLICAGLLTQIEYTKSLILLAAVGVAVLNWLAVRSGAPKFQP
ncbi:MAG TPA: amino acid permease [Candidatus Dormibacteraeota bacterium]|nr:amino acid permease [Candidatus Dormibacteraeota bacterium]